jgi:hypothetical protein
MRLRHRRSRRAVGVLATCLVLVAGAVVFLRTRPTSKPSNTCVVAANGGRYTLDPAQAALASTIAAIGKGQGLPDHAVTIALATALQETQLRNLSGGDRDSVGVFQQRPSQGWGARTQLLQPRYATVKFYGALVKVPGWQTMAVTVAAQHVQRSAMPHGYAQWEAEARVLASALTGEVGAAVTCDLAAVSSRVSAVQEQAVRSALAIELGASALRPATADQGWTAAHWLVAHAAGSGISQVGFADRLWRRSTDAWSPTATTTAVTFVIS